MEIIRKVEPNLESNDSVLKFIILVSKLYVFRVGNSLKLHTETENFQTTMESVKNLYLTLTESEKDETLAYNIEYIVFYGNNAAWANGDLNKGLEYFSEGHKIAERINYPVASMIPLSHMGLAYTLKGDLVLGLEFLLQSDEIAKKYNLGGIRFYNLSYIGRNYYYRGEFEPALEYYLASYKGLKENSFLNILPMVYVMIIQVYVQLENFEQARFLLEEFKDYTREGEHPLHNELCEGMILIRAPRARDKVRGQELLLEIIYSEKVNLIFSEIASIYYLEGLFEELGAFGSPEVINDIIEMLNHLMEIGNENDHTLIQVVTLLGKLKLSFISSDIEAAEINLKAAEELVNENNIKLYSNQIKADKELLLQQSANIENLGFSQSEIREKIEIAKLNEYIEIAKRVIGSL